MIYFYIHIKYKWWNLQYSKMENNCVVVVFQILTFHSSENCVDSKMSSLFWNWAFTKITFLDQSVMFWTTHFEDMFFACFCSFYFLKILLEWCTDSWCVNEKDKKTKKVKKTKKCKKHFSVSYQKSYTCFEQCSLHCNNKKQQYYMKQNTKVQEAKTKWANDKYIVGRFF